jgi:hypothetical protein
MISDAAAIIRGARFMGFLRLSFGVLAGVDDGPERTAPMSAHI